MCGYLCVHCMCVCLLHVIKMLRWQMPISGQSVQLHGAAEKQHNQGENK